MKQGCKKKKRIWIWCVVIIAIAVFCYYQNKHIVITNYEYCTSQVGKDFDGYKIVQLSDLHNAKFGKDNKRLLDKVMKCSPDMIVITGDIVDSRRMKTTLKLVGELVKLAPVYYVTGNHEYLIDEKDAEKLFQGMTDAGVRILKDETVGITKGGSSFLLVGLDDKSLADDTLRTLIKDSRQMNVVLAHEPQHLQNYSVNGADLVLTGHAHGGQFRLPFIGGVIAPDQGFFPQYTSGKHVYGNTEMIISRGIGNSVIPVRLFNYPEVVCVELKSK